MDLSRHRRAFLLAELIVALTILAMLMACTAVTLYSVRKFNYHQWTKQRCIAAAEAQVDSVLATGHPLDQDKIASLWPRLQVEMEVQPGQGQWKGLNRVRVTASGPSGGLTVRVTLARYGMIPEPARQVED